MNLARHYDVEPETALKKTNRKFRERFKFIEDELKRDGKSLENASLKGNGRSLEQSQGSQSMIETTRLKLIPCTA